MGYSKEYFAQELGKRFPEFHGAYEEHLEYYEELRLCWAYWNPC